MKKKNRDEILHIMRNIATKFKSVEDMHETQKHMIHSINQDLDRIWGLADAKINGKTDKR